MPLLETMTTERLILRAPDESDLGAVARVHGDPETNRFNPAGPMPPAKAAAMLAEWMEHWRSRGFGYWAVAERGAPQVVVGFGGVMRKTVAGLERLNLYFRFSPGAWGRGYGAEVARAAVSAAFDRLGAEEVFAVVRLANLPSRRTLENAGLIRIGDLGEQNDDGGPGLLYRIGATAPPR